MEDQQDAARLDFDGAWKNVQCLNICEVEQLLRTAYMQSEATSSTKPHLEMAFKHARRFSKFKDSQSSQELRMALDDWEAPLSEGSLSSEARLASFEQAQLVNLVPTDAEEAVALIPSLDRFSPVDISSVLDILMSFKKSGYTGAAPRSTAEANGRNPPLSY